MQDKILDFLRRKPGYVSGEEISQHLKISRQALWKQVHHLKEAGYDIQAVPHLGYRFVLAPDRLLPSEITHALNTRSIGKKIYYFSELPSTMDVANDLANKGLPEGTIVAAETQTRGRGRLGRSWSSPKYKGIYFSLILRPRLAPGEASILTLLAAVSVCEGIREVTGLDAKIKWPNDILLSNKKVGGILTELAAETDEIRFMVIGIGLNVNCAKALLPPQAASLKEEKGENINRVELLQGILRRIEANYLTLQSKGGQAILDAWRNYATTLGKRVKIACHRRHVEGQAVDVDSDGGLLIRRDSGITEKIISGDVVQCR